MAECEERRELEGEEEEETRGSKEHNGGAGCFRLCHLGSKTCARDEPTVEGLRGARLLAKCKYLQRGLLALAGLREGGRGGDGRCFRRQLQPKPELAAVFVNPGVGCGVKGSLVLQF